MAERRTNPLFRLACDPRDQVHTMEFTLPEIERCRALYGNITAVHVSSKSSLWTAVRARETGGSVQRSRSLICAIEIEDG